jgi:LacI family transcriptional regulator
VPVTFFSIALMQLQTTGTFFFKDMVITLYIGAIHDRAITSYGWVRWFVIFRIKLLEYCIGRLNMERVSIEDVAKLAGVSITTVSRVVNNTDYPVSEKNKKKVLTAVEELHYKPNNAAQQLKKKFNNIVGLIVRDISDPYFGEIAKGVTERTSELGYLSFVCNTGRNPENELKYHEILWQHRVRGIILAGGGLNSQEYIAELKEQLERNRKYGLKIIALAPQGLDMPYISVDNKEVGRIITQYLINKGHKKIAFISGPKNVFTAEERLQGYLMSLKKNNIPVNQSLIVNSDFTWKGGYEACRELLLNSSGVTGLCCANDNISIGALHALNEKGFNIPDDVSIISVGDMTHAQYSAPPLTTVAIPRYEMGKKAVDIIVNEKEPEIDNNMIFPVKIIERFSVKNLHIN